MTPASTAPSRTSRAAVIQRAGASGESLLAEAFDVLRVREQLRARCARRGVARAELRIAIKPDLDIFEPGAPTGTDPALVEQLIALLRAHGYREVVLCDGRNVPDAWLHNRDALCVPDLVGYRFEAPAGEPYGVSWAGDDAEAVAVDRFDGSAALRVNGAWTRADFRISFAKAKTDERWGYALGLANLLGLVSPDAPAQRWPAPERALHLLRRVPPHLALIDAVDGSHGSSGSRMPRPLETDTIIGAGHALLADWIGALKMGADPHVSPLNDLALDQVGLPRNWSLHGDATPWRGWVNPSPTLLAAVRARARWPELDTFVRAVLQPVDRERFPHRDVVVEQLSATVLSRLERVTEPHMSDAVLGLLSSGLAALAGARHAFVCNVTKGEIAQIEAPLRTPLERIRASAFDDTARRVQVQASVLEGTPADARGFRFRTVGGHVHFAASRVLPVGWDEFISRVDISASIRYMNDYIGGSHAVVQADDAGRPTRQAERNLYLPQPNWISAFGGEAIDVEKLECIAYGRDRETIWWRTIASPNGSAESDDGMVSFVRTPAGEVEVQVFARQRFRLPTPVAVMGVERWPAVHAPLVADAYARFFDGTIDNMRAVFEGRPYRVGHAPDAATGPSDLRALLSGAIAVLARVFGWAPAGTAAADHGGHVEPWLVDERGFAHFAGQASPALAAVGNGQAGGGHDTLTPMAFLAELGQAVGRDLSALGLPIVPAGPQ